MKAPPCGAWLLLGMLLLPAALFTDPCGTACPPLFPSALATDQAANPRILFLIGENEYRTRHSLARFAKNTLEPAGYDSQFVHAADDDPNHFPGIENLQQADLLVLSVRRRALPHPQMDQLRAYLRSGKPLLAIRTASHAFDLDPPDQDHVRWAEFDSEILGADYEMHYGNKPPQDPPTVLELAPGAASHPILNGLEVFPQRVTSHLYKNRNVQPTVTVLLRGRVEGSSPLEPVAWTNQRPGGQRIFYTSLGSEEDFELEWFRQMLHQAADWALSSSARP